ncbi:hypothetical protein C8Q74DRAFT_1214031 [Fomes fomentarius]|nr:hypothetical protein C8Q74DRAFT_1214031 [Fomes fomentarius]
MADLSPPRLFLSNNLTGYLDDLVGSNSMSSSGIWGGFIYQILATSLFGGLTICAGVAAIALIRGGTSHPSRPRTLLLAAIGVIASLYVTSQAITAQNLNSTIGCLRAHPAADQLTLSCMQESFWDPPLNTVAIGDAIVWWRAWAVWRGSRAVSLVGLLFILLTIGESLPVPHPAFMSALNATNACTLDFRAGEGVDSRSAGLFFGDAYGTAASVLTLAANVAATALIGYQAWVNRRFIWKGDTVDGSSSSQIEKVFSLLLESGVVYCLIWTVVVVGHAYWNSAISQSNLASFSVDAVNRTLSVGTFVLVVSQFVNGALVPIIAIYPTVIVIVVTLNRSCCDAVVTHCRPDPPGRGAVTLTSIGFRHDSLELGGDSAEDDNTSCPSPSSLLADAAAAAAEGHAATPLSNAAATLRSHTEHSQLGL